MSFESELDEAGAIKAKDYDQDGKIDKIILPLINTGMDNAQITKVYVIQDGKRHSWSTESRQIRMSSTEKLTLIPFIDDEDEIEPFKTFNIEVICYKNKKIKLNR